MKWFYIQTEIVVVVWSVSKMECLFNLQQQTDNDRSGIPLFFIHL